MLIKLFKRVILGQKPSSTAGSNSRRLLSRFSFFLICWLVLDLLVLKTIWLVSDASFWMSVVLCLWAVGFFLLVVATIPFLTSQHFRPNPLRLMGDTAISISMAVLCFALLYMQQGIVSHGVTQRVALDAIYFSAVTFSTLGYGDFAPTQSARLIAAFQAILGNLHLGMVVGVMFFAVQENNEKQVSSKD
ncbi:MAG TPA: two pore domain potassium channel family protein [Calditrichaeota bacterium]|nr:two pore domain potassium channel family protein [Calditrichota bacterium]